MHRKQVRLRKHLFVHDQWMKIFRTFLSNSKYFASRSKLILVFFPVHLKQHEFQHCKTIIWVFFEVIVHSSGYFHLMVAEKPKFEIVLHLMNCTLLHIILKIVYSFLFFYKREAFLFQFICFYNFMFFTCFSLL